MSEKKLKSKAIENSGPLVKLTLRDVLLRI
jgi:hypothetical protein